MYSEVLLGIQASWNMGKKPSALPHLFASKAVGTKSVYDIKLFIFFFSCLGMCNKPLETRKFLYINQQISQALNIPISSQLQRARKAHNYNNKKRLFKINFSIILKMFITLLNNKKK